MSAPVQQLCSRVKVPLPTPATRDILAIVRTPRCRPQPEIPVDNLRGRCWFRRQPGRFDGRGVDRCVQRVQFPQSTGLRYLNSLDKVRYAPPLRSCLKDSPRFCKRCCNCLTIFNRQPARLFAINILASFRSHDRRGRMPAIPRCDQARINIPTAQNLAKVADGFAVLIVVVVVHQLFASLTPRLLNIGDGNTLNI